MVVLICTRDALLGEDQVRFKTDDLLADLLNVIFLHLQDAGKVFLTSDFNISLKRNMLRVTVSKSIQAAFTDRFWFEATAHLTLALLVLQRAVQKNNSGVLDESSHTGMSYVLIYHHSPKHAGVLDEATRHLHRHTSNFIDLKTALFTKHLNHEY